MQLEKPMARIAARYSNEKLFFVLHFRYLLHMIIVPSRSMHSFTLRAECGGNCLYVSSFLCIASMVRKPASLRQWHEWSTVWEEAGVCEHQLGAFGGASGS